MIRPVIDLASSVAAAMSDSELVDVVYSSKYQVLNRDVFDKSARAAKVRAVAEEMGKVQPSREKRVESLREKMVMHPPEQPLTPEVAEARVIFDEAKCKELLTGDGGEKLKKVDPTSYQKLQAAARSYGLLGQSTVHVSSAARGYTAPPPAPPAKPTEGKTVDEWTEEFLKKNQIDRN